MAICNLVRLAIAPSGVTNGLVEQSVLGVGGVAVLLLGVVYKEGGLCSCTTTSAGWGVNVGCGVADVWGKTGLSSVSCGVGCGVADDWGTSNVSWVSSCVAGIHRSQRESLPNLRSSHLLIISNMMIRVLRTHHASIPIKI